MAWPILKPVNPVEVPNYYYELLLCDAISLYYLRYTLTVRSLLVKLLSIYVHVVFM